MFLPALLFRQTATGSTEIVQRLNARGSSIPHTHSDPRSVIVGDSEAIRSLQLVCSGVVYKRC